MCLIFVAVNVHPRYPLVIAANRDEFYDRPTAPAAFWPESPEVLAGRDLRAGGTWIGITRTGRIAAVTNYRDMKRNKPDAPSRGKLVSGFLLSSDHPVNYLEHLAQEADQYNGFNILVGEREEIYGYSNCEGKIRKVPQGIHGLSNHLLDTPWPKVEIGKQILRGVLAEADFSAEDIFDLLLNRAIAKDEDLPDTGVGLEWERILSPIFIKSPTYGTRSSTIILLDRAGGITFTERSFDNGLENVTTVKHSFLLSGKSHANQDLYREY